MRSYHLSGHNIHSSLSPLIQNSLFKLKGLSQKDYFYSLYRKQNNFVSLNEIRKQNISGLSITIPFKRSYQKDIGEGTLKWGKIPDQFLINSSYQGSDKAQDILAKRSIINTIRKRIIEQKDQIYECYNTDIYGVKKCFEMNKYFNSLLNKENKENKHFNQKSIAIVIGGGATAQVFMSYFEQLKIKTIVINRSVDKIKQLKLNYYPSIFSIIPFNGTSKELFCEENYQQILRQRSQNLIVINTLPTAILKQCFQHNSNQYHCKQLQRIQKIGKIKQVFYMDVNYRDKEQNLQKINQNNFKLSQSSLDKSINSYKIATGLDMLIWQAIEQNFLFCFEDLLKNKQNKKLTFDQRSNDMLFKQIVKLITTQHKS